MSLIGNQEWSQRSRGFLSRSSLTAAGGVAEQVGECRGRGRHVGRALERRVLGTINFPLLRLRYFVFDGEQNYEIDFLRVLAVQLLDFSGFVCCLY